MKIAALFVSAVVCGLAATTAHAGPVREVGHDVAQTGRDTGHAVADAGRAGGHVVARTGRHIGHGVHRMFHRHRHPHE